MAREAPPTAGLPLGMADLLPGGDADLGGALARFLAVPTVQVECSGTAALMVALTALRSLAPERDEVVAPAYTCPLVALAVAHCGLRLRLCDLAPDSLDLDLPDLAPLCGHRTLAVLPTHLAGRVVDTGNVRSLARAAGAWVIEDAAQALGARTAGASVGSGSDLAFFSLAVGKGLTLFEGGALIAANPLLRAACARASRNNVPRHAFWELRRCAELLAYAALYRPSALPWAYGAPLRRALARGDRVGAAGDDFSARIPLHRVGRWRQSVGVRALARLPDWLAAGQARAAPRLARLRRIPGLTVLDDSPAVDGAEGTWPSFLVLLPDAAARETALAALWGAGLGVSLPFVHVLPDYPRYADLVAVEDRSAELPHARSFAARVLSIGNSPWLDDAGFAQICGLLERAACGPRNPPLKPPISPTPGPAAPAARG
ncbi:DegT/DnrJ/EryC1/StrS family aminotransferase [Acidovorax sp. SUPP3334]|uniref:DegT/DnrJ/EryC1/StrS family aminotransferase n=1 Tax=Acidovorax sp. SUPP3334 TaxID=2920881 RepID=UPI0023DE5758|nr:DegT/DnrJ/EryC1/StrS family aminotransferase [Acidovorax sp. SUPP3334]GKT25413.1 DegT/DnrJ/EryC1/StrS family aminotransferase [Acidovorax sp. SUPP3334]